MITAPSDWAPIWKVLPLAGGVWLEAYNGNVLPLSAWTPEEWLAWPRAFATQFAAEGGQMSRLHLLLTGSRVPGQDQAAQWAWARTGANPGDQRSNCTILRSGVGGYRLSASPHEIETGSPPGTFTSAAAAFVSQFRLTFPLSGGTAAPGTPGGCALSPVLPAALAAALGSSDPRSPGLLWLGRSGVGLGTGTVSVGQVTFARTTQVTVRLPTGADPFGLAGVLAAGGATGPSDPGAFWGAALPRLLASGAGVGTISAPFVRGSDGAFVATLPVTPTGAGPITFSLAVSGAAIRQAIGPPVDLALSLAPYAGGLGSALRNIIDNPMTWSLGIPVGPNAQPLGALVRAIYPIPTIAPTPQVVVPAHNPATWVRLRGSGFAPQTVVTWNGVRLRSANDSLTSERILVPAAFVLAEGVAQVVATNPAPGGGNSAPIIVGIGPTAPAAPLARPAISGPARLGAVLSCSTGRWSPHRPRNRRRLYRRRTYGSRQARCRPMTVHMRGFDKTMAAVKALGPDVAAKVMPPLALAKGLAKSESDGSLSWLVELTPDRSMMVNGIPFGKAPD